MKKTKSLYHGHRFPAIVISCAVRWYFRFSLSLRDVEELLLERGVVVTYETIRCWCEWNERPPSIGEDIQGYASSLTGRRYRSATAGGS
jgi:transposase-like protein